MKFTLDEFCFEMNNGTKTVWIYQNDSSPITTNNCHLRAGLFPNELLVLKKKTFVCASLNPLFKFISAYLNCGSVYSFILIFLI